MEKKKPLRVKNMMYEQQLRHLPTQPQTLDAVIDCIEKKLSPKKYAAILHNRDINDKGQRVEEHIHVMLCFKNARSIDNIAKLLGEKSEHIQAWHKKAENGFSYLIHATDKARVKYQYDISEVKANFDYPAMMQKISGEVKKADTFGDARAIKTMLDLLYVGEISKKEVEGYLTGAQYAKARRQIEDVWMKYLQNCAEQWRKEMAASGKPVKVIWIFGRAGTGKTRFAKEYARKTGQPFYMAGSSRDIFQTYTGEHTLLLDELRPRTIEYHDLLRILDPFGMDEQVMSPSRYADKPLVCDLIIVTCPYNPLSFYYEVFGGRDNPIDSFEQLNRRITLIVHMTETEISTMKYDNRHNALVTDSASIRQNPYSAINCPTPTVSAEDLYNSMFD